MKFKTLTTLGDRYFAAAAPQVWNSLPYAIKSSPSVASFFKRHSRNVHFRKLFCDFMCVLISFLLGFMQVFTI